MTEQQPETFERHGPAAPPRSVLAGIGAWNAAPSEGHAPGTVRLLRGDSVPGGWRYNFTVLPEPQPLIVKDAATGGTAHVIPVAPARFDFNDLLPPDVPVVVGG